MSMANGGMKKKQISEKPKEHKSLEFKKAKTINVKRDRGIKQQEEAKEQSPTLPD